MAQVWDPVSLQLLSYTQAQSPGQPPPPLLKRCAAVLDPLTKSVTGLLEGLYLNLNLTFAVCRDSKSLHFPTNCASGKTADFFAF